MNAFDQTLMTDVLVLGSGAAGVRAAIEASRRGVRVAVLSVSKTGHANNTAISYGGFSAVLEQGKTPDSAERFCEDTLNGGCHLNRPFLVRFLAAAVSHEVRTLEKMGVDFQKTEDGTYIMQARGGHSVPRRLTTADSSGMSLLLPLPLSSLPASWN